MEVRERGLLGVQLRLRLLDRRVHVGLRGLLVRDALRVLGAGCLRRSGVRKRRIETPPNFQRLILGLIEANFYKEIFD